MEEYELRKAVESKPCQDSVEYQRLSRKLVSKDASDGSESLDMFAS